MESFSGFTEQPVEIEVEKGRWFNSAMQSNLSDASHKRWGKTAVLLSMTVLVFLMNVAVMTMVYKVSVQELQLVKIGVMDASLRVIDSKVYMALIAGTVAEVSALFLIIIKSLFKDA